MYDLFGVSHVSRGDILMAGGSERTAGEGRKTIRISQDQNGSFLLRPPRDVTVTYEKFGYTNGHGDETFVGK